MLVRIAPEDVKVGMYVQGFDGSWLDHPFWRSRFLLSDQVQVDKIRASSVDKVIIDVKKGLGAPETHDETDRPRTAAPKTPASQPAPFRTRNTGAALQDARKPGLSPQERAIEVRRATGAINRSKIAVMAMFQDARLGKAVKTRKLRSLVEQISASVDRDPSIILNIARLKNKDEYTYLHSVAVCALMINLARTMNLDESLIEEIGMAGMLHDVGKMAVPDEILQKPGPLDDGEYETVRGHPERGFELLSSSDGISQTALDVCLHHHERMDGTGYPKRLDGTQLSVVARMSAICDVYDAITSQRPYNEPWSASKALSQMASWDGHFDKLIFRSFVESLGIKPVGTLVRLNSAMLAVVTGESQADFTLPTVRIFHSIDRDTEVPFADIEITRGAGRHAVAAVEDPADWGFDDWDARSARILGARVG